MQRSFSCSALVLRVRPSGESNREAAFLSAEEGIITATLFGGPKSALRSHVSPFNSGTLWIYRDPAKDFRKVSDFDVRSWRPGLRDLYERSSAASRIAASLLGSHGGGGPWAEVLALSAGALDALEGADEVCCERILFHFLWNWAALLGNRGDPGRCASCACEPAGDGVLWYVPGGGFLCADCVHRESRGRGLALGAGARRWLLAVQDLQPPELARYGLDSASLGELRTLITHLETEEAFPKPSGF
ncbi:MAG: recombination protein O N-terminal domain-containing protein [Spirochaetaceae bacterium]|jgi:DNA repair protein RecO (recombination protein O)|nr:recombination protein O N-terminal domain-containing protein [Spirochaetaceae bacterium]